MKQKRQLLLNEVHKDKGTCVVYVMSRDQRVHDNHALLLAQSEALEHKLPLVVLFNLLPSAGARSKEHYDFMLKGLEEVQNTLADLSIAFIMTSGNPTECIGDKVSALNARKVFFDFNPLRPVRNMQKNIAKKVDMPCVVVDTHNIIPLWVVSEKEEYAAHTIRSKIHKQLEQWLEKPDEVVSHPHKFKDKLDSLTFDEARNIVDAKPSGINVGFPAGEVAANKHLKRFIDSSLLNYAADRNVPTTDGQSNLSPYLHFGHISSLRVALDLVDAADEPPLLFLKGKLASYEGESTKQDSINALLEELIVRKELADNFCFYNPNYDSLKGAKDWAMNSLEEHRDDAREFSYSLKEWESVETHDPAWNAAQSEMMQTGKMHGYMRMYWAKKILEWSASPEEALENAIYLNDHYSIDGGDPNGYTGIMWSIAGIHDRPWFEREVYGKIRYMNEGGLRRRFDLDAYISKWVK